MSEGALALFEEEQTPRSAMTVFIAGQLAHAAGVRKATEAQRRALERVAADAIEQARRVIRP